jgi:hypothetical protein
MQQETISVQAMPRKNPHAVALGRKGGSVKSKKKSEAARRTLAENRKKRWEKHSKIAC